MDSDGRRHSFRALLIVGQNVPASSPTLLLQHTELPKTPLLGDRGPNKRQIKGMQREDRIGGNYPILSANWKFSWDPAQGLHCSAGGNCARRYRLSATDGEGRCNIKRGGWQSIFLLVMWSRFQSGPCTNMGAAGNVQAVCAHVGKWVWGRPEIISVGVSAS